MRVYNDTLNPEIWKDENEIKPDLRIMLLQVANDFYKDSELVPPPKDVLLLGSNANYNWTETSDVDVHIVIDFKELQMPQDSAKEYTNLVKYKWNTEHDIKIKDHDVEMYIQDVDHKTHATGIYSILNNKWLMKPDKQKVVLDKELIKTKYHDIIKRISGATKEKDLEALKSTLKDIYDYRQAGLDNVGEFSTENVVFKLLRTNNYIEHIRDQINDLYDANVSVD